MPDTLEPVLESREVYADFIFPEPYQALTFAETIGESDGAVNVEFAVERNHWRATVRRRIKPVHREVTVWLSRLTARAAIAGGDYDDWGKGPR